MKNIQHRLLAILLSAACILTLILLCETPACAEDFTLAAGDYHSLALKEDGTVWAWGRNDYGQLGDGTKINRSTPVQLKISGVKALVAGGLYSLALKNDGTVWTWGDNFSGQLGDGTTTQRSTPVQVKISGVKALAAGDYHSLALKEDGTVWAWGKNTYGHLGDGTIIQRSAPVQLKISGVKALAAGDYHSLALKEDGTVWAWGKNDYGQLGDGTTTNRSAPVQVKGEGRPGFSGVKALASGADHSLALKSDGTVWAWGKNDYGQLGDGTTTNRSTPVTTSGLLKTSGLSGVTALTAGYGHSLALKEDGTVWTWGYNKYGELGDGTTTNRSTPITTSGLLKTSGLSGVTALASGDHHSLVTRGDGTVWAWGNNEYGQLGDGTTANSSTPVQVKISGATAMVLAAGTYQSLMLKEDGTVWAWGADSLAPVQVKNLSGVKALAAGYDHSLALKSDGSVWAWGWNNKYGQLGDGTTANSSTPVQVKIY
jgi:alpha-tubulin suppressor-like RCC1 family protein